jgi:hypothetical protein
MYDAEHVSAGLIFEFRVVWENCIDRWQTGRATSERQVAKTTPVTKVEAPVDPASHGPLAGVEGRPEHAPTR